MARIICQLAFVVAFTGCTVNAQDPEITKEILPDTKRQGKTGVLNCTVTRQQNYKVYWQHDESQMIISSDDKVEIDPKLNEIVNGLQKYEVTRTIEGELQTYTLFIHRLSPYDAGTYTCIINVKRGSAAENPSKTGKLVVLSPPVILQHLSSLKVTVEEGDNTTLTCEADGYPRPNVMWVRKNKEALPNPINEDRYFGKSMKIVGATRQDRGVYSCIAENTVQPAAQWDVLLLVNFRPCVRPVQMVYGQAQNRGFDVVMECRIQGHPEPDLQWYKVGDGCLWDPINKDDKHKIHTHENMLEISEFWFQLQIMNVQAGDYGDYICEGKNRLGSYYATVRLVETSECQGFSFFCPWIESSTDPDDA